MSQPYSKRLTAGGPASGAGDHGSATVPAGKVWIVRDLEAYNTGAAGLALWHLPLAYLFVMRSASSDESYSFPGLHLVLEAGESIAFTVSSGSWYWFASGYELDAP